MLYFRKHIFGLLALVISISLGVYIIFNEPIDIVAKNIDSVVNITTTDGIGTGVIISSKGIIITNAHVVLKDATTLTDKITVTFTNSNEIAGIVLYYNKDKDLAVIKIETKDILSVSKLECVFKPKLGETVIAVGNPFGTLSWTVTKGIISSLTRELLSSYPIVYQSDVLAVSGNSGGPVYNLQGKIIGLVFAVWKYNGGSTFSGHTFILPAIDICKTLNYWNIQYEGRNT